MSADRRTNGQMLTEAEGQLYDRQIRLWGLDAQRRLRQSDILLAGLSGLGAEIAKNILLAGINSITLLDDECVTEDDLHSQFFVSKDDIGKNRAEASVSRLSKLNRTVTIVVDKNNLDEKADDFFKGFNLVLLCGASPKNIRSVAAACRKADVIFFFADVHGLFGFSFYDLGTHDFCVEVPVTKVSQEKITKKKRFVYPSWDEVSMRDWNGVQARSFRELPALKGFLLMLAIMRFTNEHGRRPADGDQDRLRGVMDEVLDNEGLDESVQCDLEAIANCFSILNPPSAIFGGEISQEVIKCMSGKGEPFGNFIYFNGIAEEMSSAIV